jgi:hypothetical protein
MVLNGNKSKTDDPRSSISFAKKNIIKFFLNIENEAITKLIGF